MAWFASLCLYPVLNQIESVALLSTRPRRNAFAASILVMLLHLPVAFWASCSRRKQCSRQTRRCTSWTPSAESAAHQLQAFGRMSSTFHSFIRSNLVKSTHGDCDSTTDCKLLSIAIHYSKPTNWWGLAKCFNARLKIAAYILYVIYDDLVLNSGWFN